MRLKSCAIWILVTTSTIYFQNFANQRRMNNSIQDLTDKYEVLFSDKKSLEDGAVSFFKEVILMRITQILWKN